MNLAAWVPLVGLATAQPPALTPPGQEWVLIFDGSVAPHENQLPASPLLELASSYTLEAWIWLEEPRGESVGPIFGRPAHYALSLEVDRRVTFTVEGGDPNHVAVATTPTPLALRQWRHVAGVRDGAILRLYVDAVEVAQAPWPGAKPTSASTWVLGRGFTGVIAQARLWGRALSAAELALSANTPAPITGVGLIGDWPLDDGFDRADGYRAGTPFLALDAGPNQLHQQIGVAADDSDDEPGWVRRDAVEDPALHWERKTLDSPGNVSRQALVDADDDGDLDLVLVRGCPFGSLLNIPPFCEGHPAPSLVMRFDQAQRTFAADPALLEPDDLQVVATALDAIVADFTDDGLPDVLVSTSGIDNAFQDGVYGGDAERLLVQQPGGGLADESASRLPPALTTSEGVTAGDIDGDDDLDFFIERYQGVGGELCPGPFPPPAHAPCTGVHVNDGTGVFAADFTRLPAYLLQPEGNVTRPLLFDVDADDDPDLLTMPLNDYRAPWMTVWENDGTGHFQPIPPHWLPRNPAFAWANVPVLSAVDLDSDGSAELVGLLEAVSSTYGTPERFDRDVVAADIGGRLVLFRRSSPAGPFVDDSAAIDYPAFAFGGSLVKHGDINGDGDPDLVVAGRKHPEIFFTTEGGGLRRIGRLFAATRGAITEPGDIDGDGDLDLVATSFGGGFIDLYLNPGTASARQHRPEAIGAATTRRAAVRSTPRAAPPRPARTTAPTTLGDGPVAWVASAWERSLYAIDLSTDPPTASGPFLEGTLGAATLWALDVEAVPFTRRLAVSHQIFQNGQQATVDVSAPQTPVLVENVPGNFSGDVAAARTPDGNAFTVRTGAVAGVGNAPTSTYANYRVFEGGTAWPWAGDLHVATPGVNLTCVAIAPDGRTVVFCDRLGNRIVFGSFQFGFLDEPATWTHEGTLPTSGEPQNIAIGPDGTVLVAIGVGNADAVDVFRVTAPGVVVAGTPPTIHGLPGNQQSIVFEPDGKRAWVLSTSPSPDELSRLTISAHGVVALAGAGLVALPNDADGAWLVGVDALAVTPDGSKLVAGGASISVLDTHVAVVDLASLEVDAVDLGVVAPAGVAVMPPAAQPIGCIPTTTRLCFLDGRFAVEVDWRTASTNGAGIVDPITDRSGLVYFFNPQNIEMLLKMVDACGTTNPAFWFFYAATTNQELTIRLTDTWTGESKEYFNPLQHPAAPVQDTAAFGAEACASGSSATTGEVPDPQELASELRAELADLAPVPPALAATVGGEEGCTGGPTTLCFLSGRFRIEVDWRTASTSGEGQVVPIGDRSGLVYFFNPDNIEMLIKMLDGCGIGNPAYWLFYAATTNQEFTVRVTDTATGASKEYFNPLRQAADPVQDTAAFPNCP